MTTLRVASSYAIRVTRNANISPATWLSLVVGTCVEVSDATCFVMTLQVRPSHAMLLRFDTTSLLHFARTLPAGALSIRVDDTLETGELRASHGEAGTAMGQLQTSTLVRMIRAAMAKPGAQAVRDTKNPEHPELAWYRDASTHSPPRKWYEERRDATQPAEVSIRRKRRRV